MPGRSYSSSTGYRYGGQGTEKAVNSNWVNYELRQYNPLLGRFMSYDPYHQFQSPYLAMANNPVSFVDPSGGLAVGGVTGSPQNLKEFYSIDALAESGYSSLWDLIWNTQGIMGMQGLGAGGGGSHAHLRKGTFSKLGKEMVILEELSKATGMSIEEVRKELDEFVNGTGIEIVDAYAEVLEHRVEGELIDRTVNIFVNGSFQSSYSEEFEFKLEGGAYVNPEDFLNDPNMRPGLLAQQRRQKQNEEVLDYIQYGLEGVGLVPVVGIFADGANALIYTARGDYVNAAFSTGSMVPGLGYGANAAKLGLAAAPLFVKFVDKAADGGRAFYSGAGTGERAIAAGFETIGQTRAGKNLQNLIESKNIPWSEAELMWQRLSTTWARGVPDGSTVNVFLNNPRKGAIWFKTELPILLEKGVNIIYK